LLWGQRDGRNQGIGSASAAQELVGADNWAGGGVNGALLEVNGALFGGNGAGGTRA